MLLPVLVLYKRWLVQTYKLVTLELSRLCCQQYNHNLKDPMTHLAPWC